VSARSGNSDFFVVEADEYDTAFFDKRSKFVHYRPRTLCINNLEFDHADIFDNLDAIQRQFHHLVRCVPGQGQIIHPQKSQAVTQVLGRGCWTPTRSFGFGSDSDWHAQLIADDGSHFTVTGDIGGPVEVQWSYCGLHNVENALCAMAAALHVGVPVSVSADALAAFKGVKRRLELLGTVGGVSVYDDFAHHPTAIATTLEGLRARGEGGRLIALIEPRSNTMRMGEHRAQLAGATAFADKVFWFQPAGIDWSLESVVENSPVPAELSRDMDDLIRRVTTSVHPGDQVVIMSNGSFGGIHQRLLAQLPTI
jgi:UDP-N-acetylmuramate: L-alanyl-gamma-D-glutamyl-meso-diaminopimelate ligase